MGRRVRRPRGKGRAAIAPRAASVALVRAVSPRIAECELTHVTRVPIDPGRAFDQHHTYCQILAELGARVEWLAALPQDADGVFVEDTAVVVDEVAVIGRPGVASRGPETASMAVALSRYRPLRTLPAAACLEGGDVMRVGRTLYVGRSARTNHAGVEGLRDAVADYGYQVRAVALNGCLHLKTACTFVPPGILLYNPDWIDASLFPGLEPVAVDSAEPFGANTLTLGDITLVGAQFPHTRERLEQVGIRTRTVDLTELAKAEGALTCSSVIVGPRID